MRFSQKDFKCTLTLCDTSPDQDNEDININIFRSEAEMPNVEAGDIVIVFSAKFQLYNGSPSLLTTYRTDIHVYEAQRLPDCRRSGSARGALKSPSRPPQREPGATETEYVLRLFDRIDRSILPDQEGFSARARQSLNVKDKFNLLQDVRDGRFADLVVQVVKEPFDLGDKMTLWVSDYTTNNSFFHQTMESRDWADGVPTRDGDPYGYLSKKRKNPTAPLDDDGSKWSGPEGKRSLQLTCWDPHATFIRHNVHKDDWVRLRNVQIRFGHNSVNIEGYLREDREYPHRVYVEPMESEGTREELDQRVVDAILRKRDYEKARKQGHKPGDKRKAQEDPKKENAKSKRQKKREIKEKAFKEEATKIQAALGFNELIISEHQDKAIVPLSTILQPVFYNTSIANQQVKLEMPFTCAKYRTNVRVVDFHPTSLKDFAVGRIPTEYDLLLDNDEDSNSDHAAASSSSSSSPPPSSPHSEAGNHRRRRRHHHRIWEWRFALKLEEVSATIATKTKIKTAPAQTWVVVDNLAAQLLLDLDATNLSAPANASELDTLRERLFRLWGNLEERKSRLEARRLQHARDPLKAPPAASSDNDDDDDDEGPSNAHAAGSGDDDDADAPGNQLSNRPFTCCIKQYGIPVTAKEGEVATAGEGKKWQRMFGLFGTKIRDE